jgi:predicted MFS family arabinose efflux permease
MILMFTMGQGLGNWYAAFIMRTHGMAASELGLWFGILFGGGGLVGLLLGERIVRQWFANDEPGQMRLAAAAVLLGIPFFAMFLLLSDGRLALLALLPQILISSAFLTLPFILLQHLVPENMRATSISVVMLVSNLIGMGLGPQIVGSISDLLTPSLGVQSLRYAMLCMLPLGLWSSYHFACIARTIEADLRVPECDAPAALRGESACA